MKVFFGRLTQELNEFEVDQTTTLEEFCNKVGITYDASVRVNAEISNRSATLRAGDVVTVIDNVDGGN